MGVSDYLKAKSSAVEIIGLQPAPGSSIPGIRRWPAEYLPKIFNSSKVDKVYEISQITSEETMREMAIVEGIFAGPSSGGGVAAAVALAKDPEIHNAVICTIICDRGDRYLSSGDKHKKRRNYTYKYRS